MPSLLIAGARDRMGHPDGMVWMAGRMPQAAYGRIEHAACSAYAAFIWYEGVVADRICDFVESIDSGENLP